MEYQVKIIDSPENADKGTLFTINNYMWTCLTKPKAYGTMTYLKDKGFYVEMTCEEKNPKKEYHNYMDPVCKDSAMEIFLAFPPKGEPLTNDCMYTNFEINANAALYAAYGKGRKNRSSMPQQYLKTCSCRTTIHQDRWTLSLLIPEPFLKKECGLSQLDEITEFYCNFYKISESPEIEHYAAYHHINNPTPNFHLPIHFAKARITP